MFCPAGFVINGLHPSFGAFSLPLPLRVLGSPFHQLDPTGNGREEIVVFTPVTGAEATRWPGVARSRQNCQITMLSWRNWLVFKAAVPSCLLPPSHCHLLCGRWQPLFSPRQTNPLACSFFLYKPTTTTKKDIIGWVPAVWVRAEFFCRQGSAGCVAKIVPWEFQVWSRERQPVTKKTIQMSSAPGSLFSHCFFLSQLFPAA